MKKFIFFVLIIASFTIICIFMTEKTDVLGLHAMPFNYSFSEQSGKQTLSWERLPYPCFYRVDTLEKTTGRINGESEMRVVASHYTFSNHCEIMSAGIPLFYRVTAYGIFGSVKAEDNPVANPDFPDPPRPVPILSYTEGNPASLMPFLVWHNVPKAVCYEVELLKDKPENEGGTELSSKQHLFSTQSVFTNGWQADFRKFLKSPGVLYWRVRALDFHHKPIGTFCDAQPIYIDPSAPMPKSPLPNDYDRPSDFKQPLYPVYQWIPLNNALRYEVELMTVPPDADEEHGTVPSRNRVWGRTVTAFCAYDEYPRPYAGDYYWRVRAVDKHGYTIGTWSDVRHFSVAPHSERVYAAVFGDSITHGGGSLSYSPANIEYCYNTYLDFPTVNLGRSGDTSHTSMLRFKEDVLPFHPQNLLILTGSNSLRAPGVSAESIISDLDAIRRDCEENDIRPIFITLMPINPAHIRSAFATPTDPGWRTKMDKVNAWINQQPYHIDIAPFFFDRDDKVMDPELALDGLHPDIEGKKLMAEIINMNQGLLR